MERGWKEGEHPAGCLCIVRAYACAAQTHCALACLHACKHARLPQLQRLESLPMPQPGRTLLQALLLALLLRALHADAQHRVRVRARVQRPRVQQRAHVHAVPPQRVGQAHEREHQDGCHGHGQHGGPPLLGGAPAGSCWPGAWRVPCAIAAHCCTLGLGGSAHREPHIWAAGSELNAVCVRRSPDPTRTPCLRPSSAASG